MSSVRFTRFTVIASLVFALSGCGSLTYRPPASGPTAQLTIRNSSFDSVIAFSFEDANTCKGPYTLGDPGPTQEITRLIPAGRDVTFRIGNVKSGMYLSSCFILGTWAPAEGGDYLLTWATDRSRCRVLLTERTPGTGAERHVNFERRTEASRGILAACAPR